MPKARAWRWGAAWKNLLSTNAPSPVHKVQSRPDDTANPVPSLPPGSPSPDDWTLYDTTESQGQVARDLANTLSPSTSETASIIYEG